MLLHHILTSQADQHANSAAIDLVATGDEWVSILQAKIHDQTFKPGTILHPGLRLLDGRG